MSSPVPARVLERHVAHGNEPPTMRQHARASEEPGAVHLRDRVDGQLVDDLVGQFLPAALSDGMP